MSAASLPCIFLAEDNPGDVELIRLSLEEYNVECDLLVANDGEKALLFIEQQRAEPLGCPALAILDLNLPRATGRDILRRMRESPAWSDIPIVILSSSDSERDKRETAQLGASCYIKKPSSLEAFMKIGVVFRGLLQT